MNKYENALTPFLPAALSLLTPEQRALANAAKEIDGIATRLAMNSVALARYFSKYALAIEAEYCGDDPTRYSSLRDVTSDSLLLVASQKNFRTLCRLVLGTDKSVALYATLDGE